MGDARTPASDNIYNVKNDKGIMLLGKAKVRAHYKCVASFLFVTTNYRHYIQTEVALFCTRLFHPDYYYWEKLKRKMKYITGTVYLKFILELMLLDLITWCLDETFAVHPYFMSQTGAGMSLDKLVATSMS